MGCFSLPSLLVPSGESHGLGRRDFLDLDFAVWLKCPHGTGEMAGHI